MSLWAAATCSCAQAFRSQVILCCYAAVTNEFCPLSIRDRRASEAHVDGSNGFSTNAQGLTNQVDSRDETRKLECTMGSPHGGVYSQQRDLVPDMYMYYL
jgi:hypothetical protein